MYNNHIYIYHEIGITLSQVRYQVIEKYLQRIDIFTMLVLITGQGKMLQFFGEKATSNINWLANNILKLLTRT